MIRLVTRLPDQQLEWRNNPDVFRTCRQNELISPEQHKAWLGRIENDKAVRFFGIEVSESSKMPGFVKKPFLVGTAGLTSIDHTYHRAEYSLLIGTEFQGRGYATPALVALLRYGFENLNLHRIWGEIIDLNSKSTHIAKKVGMVEEGLQRDTYFKDGKWRNSYIYSILQEEFFAQHGRTNETINAA